MDTLRTVLSYTGKTAIIAVKGSIYTSTIANFEHTVKEAMDRTRDIIIDFSALESIATIGLSVLAAAKNKGANIVIARAGKNVQRVFDVVGFVKLFPCVATLDEAKALIAGAGNSPPDPSLSQREGECMNHSITPSSPLFLKERGQG